MKKFLSILCSVAMVAALSTCAFATEEYHPSRELPFGVYDGDYGVGYGSGGDTQASEGEGEDQETPSVPGDETPSTPSEGGSTGGGAETPSTGGNTSAGGSGATAGGSGAGTGAKTASSTVADIKDYTKNSLAKILVSMLNLPVDENSKPYSSADVMAAMKIDGNDEKTVDGTPVDTSKLTVISKALDEKSTGVTFTKKDDGTFDVTLNGNELTKERDGKDLFIVVAPKDPDEKKAFLVDVTIKDNVLTFNIPMDAAICITLVNHKND